MVQIRVPSDTRGYKLDGANEIAKASRTLDVQITTQQVRILQAINLGPAARYPLKVLCGLGPKRVPPYKWVLQLRDLVSRGLVRAEESEVVRGWAGKSTYYSTAEGRRVLRLATEAVRSSKPLADPVDGG